jgi:hypothetical protein
VLGHRLKKVQLSLGRQLRAPGEVTSCRSEITLVQLHDAAVEQHVAPVQRCRVAEAALGVAESGQGAGHVAGP